MALTKATLIADDAVDTAQLTHGTQGDTLIYGASGAPARLAAGTAGQAMISGGAGADPAWGTRKLVAQSMNTLSTYTTSTTTVPKDDTIPQITEGAEILTVQHTPAASTNRLVIRGLLYGNCGQGGVAALFKDSDANAISVGYLLATATNEMLPVPILADFIAGGVAQITIRLRVGPVTAGTFHVNGSAGAAARLFGGALKSYLIVDEYLP